MSYKINQTDGTLLVDLVDGKIDVDTTDLTLVGRNYTGYGEFVNENFIKLLENFANTAAPAQPLEGQLWYDSSESRLKVYNGVQWKSTDTTNVSAVQPTMLAGDVWIDSVNNQIYFSDGTDVILAGPVYNATQGETGWSPATVTDIFGIGRTVNRLMIGTDVVAVHSKELINLASIGSNAALLPGFGSTLKAGINVSSNFADYEFHGGAEFTRILKDNTDQEFSPNDFLQVAKNNTTTGSLHIDNDLGLIVGDDSVFEARIQGGLNTILRNTKQSGDLRLQVRQSGSDTDAIFIDATQTRVGFWTATPQYTFDFNGNARITGNLIVEGDTTTLDVSTLRVEDKTIELAISGDSSELTDAQVDGAGIEVRSSDNPKTILWSNTYNSWDLSCNANIPSGFAYKINGTDILTSTTLSPTVTSATGITQIGTLTNLDVDNININGNTITSSVSALTLTSPTDIQITNSRKITGVGTPEISDDPSVVATKEYVDEWHLNKDEFLYLDATGLTNSDIELVLEDLIPTITKNTGVYCVVHCVEYTGTYTYNAADGLTKSFVAVDKNGVENQSVLQDISFAQQADQPVTLTPTRTLRRFIIDGASNWKFVQYLPSSV